METKDEKFLRMKEIAFIGKVTASLSHEMKNILATINESLGLTGDLFTRADQGKIPDLTRLGQINIGMQEQIKRGVEIVKRLNRFAHSMDEQVAYHDLNDVVMLTGNISERSARLKGIDLEIKPADSPINIYSHPFKVEQIVFGCIEYLLNLPEKKSRITIVIQESKGDTCITISDDSPSLDPSCENDRIAGMTDLEIIFLDALIKEIGGSIDFAPSPSGNKITLSLPPKPP